MQVGAILLIIAVSYKIPKLREYFLPPRRPKDQTENLADIDVNILSPKELTFNTNPPLYVTNTYITPTTQTSFTDSESFLSVNYWWTFLCEKIEDLFSGYENDEDFDKCEYDADNFNNFSNFNNFNDFDYFNNDFIFGEKGYQRETIDHPYISISKLNKDNNISRLDNKYSHASKLRNKAMKDSHVSKLDNKCPLVLKLDKNKKDPLILKLDKNINDPLILKLDNRPSNEIQEINKNQINHTLYSHNGPSMSKSSESSEQMDFGTSDLTNSLFEHNASDSDKALKLRTLLKKKHDSEVEIVKCLKKALVIQGNREVLVKNVIREVEVLRNRMDRDFGQ